MKYLIIFAFLVAGTAAAVFPVEVIEPMPLELNEKNIISDVCNAVKCIEDAINNLQDKINNVVSTILGVADTYQEIIDNLNTCLSIGGDNPSIIDQIAQAQCLFKWIDSIKAAISGTVDDIKDSIQQVVGAGNGVVACVRK